MRTWFALAGASLALLVPAVALAADGDPVEVASIATWFPAGNYLLGATLALFGAVGAIFTAFTLVGGVVPGTAGKAQLDKDKELLDRLTANMETSLKSGAAGAADLRQAVNDLRDDYNSERNRQYFLGALLYIFLGAFFSALLAKDILQALAFGAGWTGVIGSLGLKNDFDQRKDEKDDALATLTTAVAGLTKRSLPKRSTRARPRRRLNIDPPTSGGDDPSYPLYSDDAVDTMLANAEVARSL